MCLFTASSGRLFFVVSLPPVIRSLVVFLWPLRKSIAFERVWVHFLFTSCFSCHLVSEGPMSVARRRAETTN